MSWNVNQTVLWGNISGIPPIWNESQIPDLGAGKITFGTFDVSLIPDLAFAKIPGLQAALDGKLNTSYIPDWGTISNIPSTWTTAQIPELPFSKIPGLQFQLDSKSNTTHGHTNYFELAAFNEITNYGSPTNSFESFAVKTPAPTVGYHDTNSTNKWWTLFDSVNSYILTNHGSGDVWSTPYPLHLRTSDNLARVWGNNIWHSGNLPETEGTFSPQPQGTGWGYTSEGSYYKIGKLVQLEAARVTITTVGTNSLFQVIGLPFNAAKLTWISYRIRNLQSLPADYSFSGYVTGTTFRPQYVQGATAAFADISISQIKVGTELWLSGSYRTND